MLEMDKKCLITEEEYRAVLESKFPDVPAELLDMIARGHNPTEEERRNAYLRKPHQRPKPSKPKE